MEKRRGTRKGGSMAKKLKVGIVGAGGIAQFGHIPSFQKLAEVEVVALADPNKEKLEMVAKRFQIPETFADYRELIGKKEIDIISICSPNYLHKEQAILALSAGKDVLCEKPVAMNSKETEEILIKVKKTGRKFMVAFLHRFSSASVFLRKIINRGEFGDIYYARAGCLRRRGIPGLGGWFTNKKLSGGGPLIDVGVHVLDKTYWLMDAPKPVSVIGVTYQKFKKIATDGSWPPPDSRVGDKFTGPFDVEDLAGAFIRFANGATLVLEASWAGNSQTGLTYDLFGTKAGAREDDSGLKIFGEDFGVLTDTVPDLPSVNLCDAEIKDFVSCIREGRAPITTPAEILAVSKIIEGIYRSASSGREVRL